MCSEVVMMMMMMSLIHQMKKMDLLMTLLFHLIG